MESGTRAINPGLPITENITINTDWKVDPTYPYISIKTNVWVMPNVNLTIGPGVVVRFDPGTSLHVMGPFAYPPMPMAWQGISLESCTGKSVFNHVAIRYSEFGISSVNSESSITNSSIEYTFYHGIFVGPDSTMLIRSNYINFTTWAGIITDNRSKAMVENNRIKTSYYGIVCYDRAEIKGNTIEKCWLGIVGWGDANITFNQVRDCRDGIQGFFASPLVANNTIISCDGNGTRFITSNAILRNNILVYNKVGMDIDYNSKHLLDTMENNLVNGIDIKNCFFVGKNDLVIDGLFVDSGWSKGFYGSLTAQGSVTLYDCRNVTIRNSTIINTVNSIYATNSTFTIYNSTFDNAAKSQIFLEANATGTSFNRSVNPDSVMIAGINCMFQTFDNLQVKVVDYYGAPILGARVFVRESQLVLHDVTTSVQGTTPVMLVKDRTVSESGVIKSPLSVEVLMFGYHFDPNPQTGVHVANTSFLLFTDLGDIFPPTMTFVSIENGDRAFQVNGSITIHFSEPMNKTSVEKAFSITGNVTGAFSWEGNNLTFTPDALAYATYYTVVISTDAKDLWDNHLETPISFSFTTVHEPATSSNMMPVFLIVIFLISGIAGFLILKRFR